MFTKKYNIFVYILECTSTPCAKKLVHIKMHISTESVVFLYQISSKIVCKNGYEQ